MKKITFLFIFTFTSAVAFAQEEKNDVLETKNVNSEVIFDKTNNKKEVFASQNIFIPAEDGIKVGVEKLLEEPTENAVAISNSKNLKMLYVASSLFYTHNYALT